MKTWRTKKAGLSAAALTVVAGVVLITCSDGSRGTTQEAPPPLEPGPTTGAPKLTDKTLGETLGKLAFQDAGSFRKNDGACLTGAIRKAGMPEEAPAYIAEADGDGMGTVIDEPDKASKDAAALLASWPPREDFDVCIDKAAPPNGNSSPRTRSCTPPNPAAKPAAGKPNLKPAYPVRADQPVNSSTELTKGLVSMPFPYARDEGQKNPYAAAGQCLAALVYGVGFS
ncbi:hypothetical protein [Streptomyces acidiscabies]|uniref:Lipoprotein n=1 Tax=Streptomyces acidiscabies TaxID=42234 RepID=A0ABU4LYF3_9ACTN|nr:hypothetical protein [Streptomyces acidiscabies]MDX3019988.1 hypothetical protein [Streptomyces acidiscabies]